MISEISTLIFLSFVYYMMMAVILFYSWISVKNIHDCGLCCPFLFDEVYF